MKPTSLLATVVALVHVLAPPTAAQERPFGELDLALHWGTFGVLDTEEVVEVGLEGRFVHVWKNLRPILGTSILADGGNYTYAGGRYELSLWGGFCLAPSFAAGIYSSGGIDLGGPLEFRSGLDLTWDWTADLALGVGLYHLSNGGIYGKNGGSESLLFSVVVSL